MASLFGRIIRYAIAIGCIGLVIFWNAKEPPVLDMKQMQVTEGVYDCIRTGGSARGGPSGPHIIDGVSYFGHFSFIFGIHAPGGCFKELNGHRVRMSYLRPTNSEHRLTLEVLDLQSGRIYGITKEKRFAFYQMEIENKSWFYLSKLGLLLLALRLTCWSRLKVLFQQFLNRTNNHGISR